MTSVRLLLSRALVVGLVASLGAVCSTMPASAEPTWTPPVDVATEIPVVNWYDVDHLPDDTTAIVWGEESAEGDGTVYFATRGLGDAAFSSAEPLSGGYAWNPQIVVGAQGAVIVAWIQVANGQSVQVTRLEPGATDWSTPEIVSSHSTRDFQLLVDRAGTVTVLSRHELLSPDDGPDTYRVDANTRPDGGEWSGPQIVAEETPHEIEDLRAVVDAEGRVTAVWTLFDEFGSRVHVASNDAEGVFFEAPLSEGEVAARAPDVAASPMGGVAVSWAQKVAPGADDEVAVLATRSPGASSFTVAEAVGGQQDELLDTEVVVDTAGTTTLLSAARTGAQGAIIASTRPQGLAFSSQVLTATVEPTLGEIAVTVAPDRALTALWQLGDFGSLTRVQATHRATGEDFGPAIDLASPDDPDTSADDTDNFEPAGAVDSSGDVTVVWGTHVLGAARYAVRTRVLDIAGPIVDHVAVPAVATAGSAVGMSLSAFDHWSGPPSVEWSFGDGATSYGASTSHVYAAGGTYQVSVTATDGVGNATTLTRTMTVAAPTQTSPAPPTPIDRVAPVLSRARVAPKALPASRPAMVRVTSSESATLVGVVQRRTGGRWKRVGRKQWSVEVGANSVRLYGRAAQPRLRPGKYRVRLVASDPAGNASTTTTVGFRVDRGS